MATPKKVVKSRSGARTVTLTPAIIAAIYLRVSTEEQAKEGYGLEVQIRRTQAQAVVKGWEVEPRHVYRDEGVSGALPPAERPGMAALLAAVAAGEIQAVIVLSLDRLGRKTRIVLDVVDQITEGGAELISCKESLDTSTPAGRFVLTMFAALAQLERDNITERTTGGRDERGLKDGEKGGPLPYGYRRIRNAEGKATGVEADRTLAAIVRRIDREAKRGTSQRQIAAALNAAAVPGPRGGLWYASSVGEVLKNRPAYRGGLRGESASSWPPILH